MWGRGRAQRVLNLCHYLYLSIPVPRSLPLSLHILLTAEKALLFSALVFREILFSKGNILDKSNYLTQAIVFVIFFFCLDFFSCHRSYLSCTSPHFYLPFSAVTVLAFTHQLLLPAWICCTTDAECRIPARVHWWALYCWSWSLIFFFQISNTQFPCVELYISSPFSFLTIFNRLLKLFATLHKAVLRLL